MLYDKILNPKTNRYVKVNGRIGRQILKQYILAFYQTNDRQQHNRQQRGGSSPIGSSPVGSPASPSSPGSIIREKFEGVGQTAGHMVDTAKHNLDNAVKKTKETFFSLVNKVKNAFHTKTDETKKAIGGAMEKVEGVAEQVETFMGLRSSKPSNHMTLPKSQTQRQLESLQSMSKSTLNEFQMR